MASCEYKLAFSDTVKSLISALPKISSVYLAEYNWSKLTVEYPHELKAEKLISSFLKSVCFNKILAPLFNIIWWTSDLGNFFLLMILDPFNSSLISSAFFKVNWYG